MRALVIYESMYGNTHLVADAIGEGLRALGDVSVVAVHAADAGLVAGADLVVVGGPTHAHGLSREATRKSAAADAAKPEKGLALDPDAEGEGLREWFEALGTMEGRAAAFDTRVDIAPVLSGRASKGIDKRLRRHGFDVIVEPESFLVRKDNHLEPGEQQRAKDWGTELAAAMALCQ